MLYRVIEQKAERIEMVVSDPEIYIFQDRIVHSHRVNTPHSIANCPRANIEIYA